MSNKPKRTVDWFPHMCVHKDSLRIVEGTWREKGYTCWFKLLERLGATPDHRISLEDDNKKLLLLWSQSGLSPEDGMEIFALFAELGMIDKDLLSDSIIWSDNFVEGISVVYKNRKRDLPQKPNSDNMNLFPTGENEQTTGQKPGSREERSREEEEEKEYVRPLLGEHQNVKVTAKELASLNEYVGGKSVALDLIERLSIYLKSTGKKYANHYATMQGWHRREGGGAVDPELEAIKKRIAEKEKAHGI